MTRRPRKAVPRLLIESASGRQKLLFIVGASSALIAAVAITLILTISAGPDNRSAARLTFYSKPALPKGANITVRPVLSFFDSDVGHETGDFLEVEVNGVHTPVDLYVGLWADVWVHDLGSSATRSEPSGQPSCGPAYEADDGAVPGTSVGPRHMFILLKSMGKGTYSHCSVDGFAVVNNSFVNRSIVLEGSYSDEFADNGNDDAPTHGATRVDAFSVDMSEITTVNAFRAVGGSPDRFDPDNIRILRGPETVTLTWANPGRETLRELLVLGVSALTGIATALVVEALKSSGRSTP
jgi:hypothetical protein